MHPRRPSLATAPSRGYARPMLDAPTSPPPTTPVPALPPRPGFWRRVADRFAAFVAGGGRHTATAPQGSVAFTIAVIALGAKLAKADGQVHRSEVSAFRRIFVIPRSEEKNAARVFDLARQTPVGFDAWAQRIRALFPAGDPILEEVVEGLAIVAAADGQLNEAERAFITDVANIFDLAPERLAAILARHDPGRCMPCDVLGITPDTPLEEARARWRALVREAHPDRALAHGLPPEAVRLAEIRTRRLNEAWQQFRATRAGAA